MEASTVILVFAGLIVLFLAVTLLKQFFDKLTAWQKERPFLFAVGLAVFLGSIVVVGLSLYPGLSECWPQHRMACFLVNS
jgi:uncharacterized membrane protein YgdD (TMEM256/DUF423 family)